MNVKKKLKDLFNIVDGIWVKFDSIVQKIANLECRMDELIHPPLNEPPVPDYGDDPRPTGLLNEPLPNYEQNMYEATRLFGEPKSVEFLREAIRTGWPPVDMSTFNLSFKQGFEAGMLYLNLCRRPNEYGPILILKDNMPNVGEIANSMGYKVLINKRTKEHEVVSFHLREQ